MSDAAKIHLSKIEKELVENKDWILTKRIIIKKVYDVFGALHESYKKQLFEKDNFLEPLSHRSGKVSNGENYEGLPYVILDYPALFSKEKIVAVRTMFWWGNFFSITLHIAGQEFKKNVAALLQNNFLQENNFYICINENQWQHSFDESNYIHAAAMDSTLIKKISANDFFKISKQMDISRWDDVPAFLEKSFSEILEWISLSFPAGERVL